MIFVIVAASVAVSLISLIGIIFLFDERRIHALLRPLISIAAGSLLAVAFLDLLPEAVEAELVSHETLFGAALLSMLAFFVFERALHWHHCSDKFHGHVHDKKNLAYVNLAGDAIHNVIDGVLIASAFMLSVPTGLVVTMAVIIHEIPQEISDFSVLLYAGLTKARAIMYNLVVAFAGLTGAVLFYFLGQSILNLVPIMAAVAAGNFIYLAAADLMPELYQEKEPRKVVHHTVLMLLGVVIIYAAHSLLPHVE